VYEQEGIEAYLHHYRAMHHTCPSAFDGIKELLEMLSGKGVKLAMVPGKGLHSARISLKQFGLESYFEVLETGSPDGPDKVKGIRNVLSRLGADPKLSLYVGDAPSDIRYCKEVGIPIVAAAWASTTDANALIPLQPDWLFYTVDEFKDWADANT
jgi:phosphoglycolate phosphatase/pyrophosphatase PpaX